MKGSSIINVILVLVMLCTLISCDNIVTDDKGIVTSIKSTSYYPSDNNAGKKYYVEVRIECKHEVIKYKLYTNKLYRVGDSIFIK